ncbi:MAG: hypothetical protein QM648_06765 [Solirubrobacterales bacterium]
MTTLLAFAAVVFGVNLLPAFGPPTWIIVVYFKLHHDIPLPALVFVGAAAATCGRVVLALAARGMRTKLPQHRIDDLEALRGTLERGAGSTIAAVAFFVVSPVPSAQLFLAAGVTGLALRPLAIAFFAGRLASYAIYGSAASLAEDQLSAIFDRGFSSPWAVGLQVLMLAGVVAITLVPWRKVFAKTSTAT